MASDLLFNCELLLTNAIAKLQNPNLNIEELVQMLKNISERLSNPTVHAALAAGLIESAVEILENCSSKKKGGRPQVLIHREGLAFMLKIGMKVKAIAKFYQVNCATVFRRMKDYGLSVSLYYSEMPNEEFDSILRSILLEHPNTGYKRMIGFLKSRDIRVPTSKLKVAMRRVDPEGVERRRSTNRAIYRREYFVKYSMELWHIDTHHKLIRYGFVVRGGIDGKSRTIVYLDVGCENTSKSNLYSFLDGVKSFGIPFRTRSDKGGENVDIADFMLRSRGINRGSHICGRSVHNQRIERLWRDVHYGCLTGYKQMFLWLENIGVLDLDDPRKLAILQYVFLPRLKKHLKEFASAWNLHSLSTENGQTPLQLMMMHLPPPSHDMFLDEGYVDEILTNNEFAGNGVTVEPYEEFLTMNDKQILEGFDVMRASNNLGADVYIEIITAINQQGNSHS